ncbi:MAG: hypothetical protein ORN49_03985 [Rhodobacteraceae bacterium]|nr:hypothetical protein [Paracoccaceae bacterium]
MAKLPDMKTAAFTTTRPLSEPGGGAPEGGGPSDGPDPRDADDKSVQFINAEVLDPPKQGSLNFVGPYVDQTLAMALEDARSFLQGAEQILLVVLAKVAEKYLGGGSAPPVALGSDTAADAPAPVAGPGPEAGFKAFESVLGSLASYHSAMAETAHKYRVER